jgi:tetratricopeptide (TPR) repeat protein
VGVDYVFSLLLVLVAISATPLPSPSPPEAPPSNSGYYLNAHQCVVNLKYPYTRVGHIRCMVVPGHPSVTVLCEAGNAYRAGDYAAAAALYRRALKAARPEHYTQWDIDLNINLPLSMSLYRAGHLREAEVEWRALLARHASQIAPQGSDSGTSLVLMGRLPEAFWAYAINPPGFNQGIFGDSGAAYNLQRGLNAAARGDAAAARRYLTYALECSPDFSVAHLILGVVYLQDGNVSAARREWIADLDGGEADPPDTASILGAQYDAMRLLLRYR